MAEYSVGTEGVRQAWQDEGADVAEALFQAREVPPDARTRWWHLGCELALARADLPAVLARWQNAWASAEQQPAQRRTLAEWLWSAPWDQALVPLWQQVADALPGKHAWRRQQVNRGVELQRLASARALMGRAGDADTAVDWGRLLVELWAGDGDEAWAGAWLRHLDGRWLIADDGHSNYLPDAAAFARLDQWVEGGHVAVIDAWRARVPSGAWADWLALAAQVAAQVAARGSEQDAQAPLDLSWPDSVLQAWPKPLQRQALARLALLAGQAERVRPLWLDQLGPGLSKHWPVPTAERAAAQIELAVLRHKEADSSQMLAWLETKAQVEEIRSWWAPRALRECLRDPDTLQRWWDWCEQYGQPELGPGAAGLDALVAMCQSGRVPQARELLRQWRRAVDEAPSQRDRAWLAVGEATLAQLRHQPALAWEALNGWWQSQGLAPLAAAAAFSPMALVEAPLVPAAAASALPEAHCGAVTAVLLWPRTPKAAKATAAGDDEDGGEASAASPSAVEAGARVTLRSLLQQDATDLSVLVVADRALPEVDALAAAAGRSIRVLQLADEPSMSAWIRAAVAAVDTPWLIWAQAGSAWHPQALRARQQHLGRQPQAEASQALRLSLTPTGAVTSTDKRSGQASGQDAFMVRTALLRDLPAPPADATDGWAAMREQVVRRLGGSRRLVWPCTMGLSTKARHAGGVATKGAKGKPAREPILMD